MKKPTAQQIAHWAERISASDRTAFNRLFRALYPRLVRFAFQYTRQKEAADDVVQDAFVRLWQKRREIDYRHSLKAYLYKMVRNRSLNFLRDNSKEQVGLDNSIEVPDPSPPPSSKPSDLDEKRQLLKEWIEKLPERQREALKLSRFEGLDHDEIAEVMDISPATVNNHIVAALRNLRKRYDKYKRTVN